MLDHHSGRRVCKVMLASLTWSAPASPIVVSTSIQLASGDAHPQWTSRPHAGAILQQSPLQFDSSLVTISEQNIAH